jgi:putative PIN family toxin of toxin-antitoxin system
MISAAVDANILVRGAIASHPNSASKRLIDAVFAGRFTLLLSRDTLLELQRVLADEEIRAKHGWTDEEIMSYCRALEVRSRVIEPTTAVPASLTRDPTDTKWIALAIDGHADYLVTLDSRHLLRLKKIGKTKVVSAQAFLHVLERTAAKP